MRRSPRKTLLFFSAILILTLLAGCSFGTGGTKKTDGDVSSVKDRENWDIAETSPLGKYPELVTYTLGQMKGTNNSNLPEGQTYEDNAYTRYLKKTLNVQNKNIFMESEERYDEALNILVKDRNLPDIFLVSDRYRRCMKVMEKSFWHLEHLTGSCLRFRRLRLMTDRSFCG